MWYSNLNTTFFSQHILHQHSCTCPIALSVCRNSQHRNFLLMSQPLPHLRFNLLLISETFATKAELLYASNNSSWISFALSLYAHKINPNRTMLFGSILLKHGRHFDYWNQPLNMRMRVRYLDCHEFGLCCYLVIRIENLLRSLRLFYFRLWPVYWLSLVCIACINIKELCILPTVYPRVCLKCIEYTKHCFPKQPLSADLGRGDLLCFCATESEFLILFNWMS
jgi:hypothetical protein